MTAASEAEGLLPPSRSNPPACAARWHLAIEAIGEATALTESCRLKAGDFLEIVTSTMFARPSYQRYDGNIARDTYEPGFKLTLGLKDVNLALDAAKAKDASLSAAEIVRGNLQSAIEGCLITGALPVVAAGVNRAETTERANRGSLPTRIGFGNITSTPL